MAAIVHVVEGPDAGRVFQLSGDLTTIGRNAENTITLNDGGISGTHTKIERDASGQFTIHDASSTNGTFLNGKELRAGDLKDGDRIGLGQTILAFELQASSVIEPGMEPGQGVVRSRSQSEASFKLHLPEFDPSAISLDQLMRSFRRGQVLDAYDRALEGLDGSSEILEATLQACLAVSEAELGSVLLIDQESGEMVPGACVSGQDSEGEFGFSKSLAFDVATSGQAYAGEAPASASGAQASGSVICVPVRTTRKTGGVLYLTRSDANFAKTDAGGKNEALPAVEAISRRAGVALSAIRWRVDFELLFSSTIDAIMATIQAKDVYTRGHSERVRHYSKLLAKELGLSGEQLSRVTLGAALHDIGKVGMPDSVLKHNTNARLTPEQMKEVRKHPVRGAKILGDITFLKDVIPAAELHHEDWGGGGYPHGMEGEEIPLIARIVAVADTYDAITTDRPYQKGKSYEEGHVILRKIAGARLEPELVEHFIEGWYRYRKGPARRRSTAQTGRLEQESASNEAPPPTLQLEPPEVDDRLEQIIQIG